jgi:acyl-CoA thioesterase
MSSLSYFVHFIADPPASPLDDPAYTLAVFRCNWARDGYAEDDGALWSADGQLLARSKQVVLVGN